MASTNFFNYYWCTFKWKIDELSKQHGNYWYTISYLTNVVYFGCNILYAWTSELAPMNIAYSHRLVCWHKHTQAHAHTACMPNCFSLLVITLSKWLSNEILSPFAVFSQMANCKSICLFRQFGEHVLRRKLKRIDLADKNHWFVKLVVSIFYACVYTVQCHPYDNIVCQMLRK